MPHTNAAEEWLIRTFDPSASTAAISALKGGYGGGVRA